MANKVKRGEFYRNNGDGRVYKVLAVGKNLDSGNATTVAFKQVVNANDDAAIEAGTVKLGKKSYFRTKASFVGKYAKVVWQKPVASSWQSA